ncbi:hypothetical protein Tco_0218417 [Tanacetum coccineum]
MVDAHLGTRLRDSIQKDLRSYTVEFKKEAQAEKERYIDLIEKSVKDIINDEVKTQLPQILPKAVSDFATPVIKSTFIESLEDAVLAKSSSQPQSTYKATTSLTELELKKILIDKMEKIQSNLIADEHNNSYLKHWSIYNVDKDLFLVYGKAVSLKRGANSYSDDIESAIRNQEQDMGNTDDQPNVEVASKYDGFKKPKRPSTPDSDWNVVKSFDFRPPQTWISKIAQAEKPPISFDKLMNTPIDFLTYAMNHLNIDNLTKDHLVGPVFNLLEGTCKSHVELEYNIEECYKAVIDRLDWNNPEGKEYPFDLSKPLPLFMDRGRQVVLVDYFINNDLEYLRGGSSSKKYTTSTTKTKAAKYDIQGIEDMGPKRQQFYGFASNRVSKYDVYSTKRIIAITKVKVMKWYDYGYLEEIEVRREDRQLYKFKEGDFPRLHLHDIEDMLLLLVQTKLSNLERDVIFDLGMALRMFTRHIIILKLMRTDEVYKFSDGTLTFVRTILHDIASNLRMDYLLKKRWTSLDRKRSLVMIKAIDQLLLERRLMRNLEKFIGRRDYGEDLRLLQRTI